MKQVLLFLIAMLAVVASAQVGDLERSTPAQQGVDPAAVDHFFKALMADPKTQLHHAMVVRHGRVIAEVHPAPYRAQDSHTLYSASKTFTSMAVGIAIDENRLRLTDRVASFFPDQLPDTIGPNLAAMTVRDLLTMASGIKPDWVMRNNGNDWIKTWLSKDVDHQPGTFMQYDSMCTYVLAAIVQRVTGTTVLDYLNQHVFGPMHITQADWELSPEGINTGGWGLRLQTESLAKAGILMLNRGQWQGQQLVPALWIDEMVKPQINYANVTPTDAPTHGNQGYGYQVWRCKDPEAYRADGAFGQYIVCLPRYDMVVVITGMSHNGHGELDCIWQHLVPGIDNVAKKHDRAQQALDATCNKGSKSWATTRYDKFLPSLIKLGRNKHNISTIDFADSIKSIVMILKYTDGHHENIVLGYDRWQYTSLAGNPPYSIGARDRFKGLNHDFQAAGVCSWAGDAFKARIEYVNWISAQEYTIDPSAGTVTITDSWTPTTPEVIKIIPLKPDF